MNNIKDIDLNRAYEGYIWMSNENQPHIYRHELIPEAIFYNNNPFVAEGYLFDKEANISISIKYIDGKYHIYKFQIKDDDRNNPNTDTISYYGHRMASSQPLLLQFLRYWEPMPDEACLNMPVLMMSKQVFIGFKAEEK